MTRITLDGEMLRILRAVKEDVELCDAQGRVVGSFSPLAKGDLHREGEEPFTAEELDRFAREPGGRSLEEIMNDLRKLA